MDGMSRNVRKRNTKEKVKENMDDVHSSFPKSPSLDMIHRPHDILYIKHRPAQQFVTSAADDASKTSSKHLGAVTGITAHCKHIDEKQKLRTVFVFGRKGCRPSWIGTFVDNLPKTKVDCIETFGRSSVDTWCNVDKFG